MVPLFEPDAHFTFNRGCQLYNQALGPWDITKPEAAAALCEEIERVALPLLRPVETINDFVAFTVESRFRDTYLELYPIRKIYVDLARGDLDAARLIYDYFKTDKAKRQHKCMPEEFALVTETIRPLLSRNDRAGLAQLLHDLEAGAVKRLKLQKIWEPTPFPFEARTQA